MALTRHPQRKLRNFLIYPRFQLSLVFTQALLLGVLYLIASWGVDTAFEKLRDSGVQSGFHPGHPYFAFVEHQKALVLKYFSIAITACAVIYGCVSIVISHRVAGPLVRLRRIFKEMSEQGWSAVTPVHFRKGDFFRDLPEELNRAMTRLAQDSGIQRSVPPAFRGDEQKKAS